MKARTWQLLQLLADGKFHSGENLAQQLNLSRATIFNTLASIADYGVVLQRVRGRGYRLAQPWHPLSTEEISAHLGNAAPQFRLEVLQLATSSNALLLQRATQGAASGSVLAVELQTAGKGRLGRSWHAGLGNALTFSLLWRFDCGLNALSGLSLAVGVAIVRALHRLGANSARLKWPNDVMSSTGKLGGVLIEAQGDMLGPSAVVIGIGLNCSLPLNVAQRINQPACALDELCLNFIDRNLVLAKVLHELANVLENFARAGFAGLREEWEQYHQLQNAPMQLQLPDNSLITGIARGVSEAGELCVETTDGLRRFNSGEVRVKRQ